MSAMRGRICQGIAGAIATQWMPVLLEWCKNATNHPTVTSTALINRATGKPDRLWANAGQLPLPPLQIPSIAALHVEVIEEPLPLLRLTDEPLSLLRSIAALHVAVVEEPLPSLRPADYPLPPLRFPPAASLHVAVVKEPADDPLPPLRLSPAVALHVAVAEGPLPPLRLSPAATLHVAVVDEPLPPLTLVAADSGHLRIWPQLFPTQPHMGPTIGYRPWLSQTVDARLPLNPPRHVRRLRNHWQVWRVTDDGEARLYGWVALLDSLNIVLNAKTEYASVLALFGGYDDPLPSSGVRRRKQFLPKFQAIKEICLRAPVFQGATDEPLPALRLSLVANVAVLTEPVSLVGSFFNDVPLHVSLQKLWWNPPRPPISEDAKARHRSHSEHAPMARSVCPRNRTPTRGNVPCLSWSFPKVVTGERADGDNSSGVLGSAT